jgi:acyl-CoA synthetase (AMP-forming)/AMP-acid ligase II
MALGEALRQGRERHPEKPALLFEEKNWTYAQFDAITDRIAASLLREGMHPGDRVALLFSNRPELAFSYYACFKIGAVAVPLNVRLKGPELEYVLNHCGARCLIGQENLFHEVQAVRASLPGVERFYLSGDAAAFPGVRPFAELARRSSLPVPFPEVTPDAVAAILYTSGSTARPKGVTHTHATLARAAAGVVTCGDVRPDDILAIATSLCHGSGFKAHLLPAVSVGATALIIPRPDPEVVLRAMARHRATWFGALPVLCSNLVHYPEAASYDLSSLRVCIAAGDAVPAELQQRFHATFGVELVEFWAMTEICPGCANPLAGRKKVGSIGPAAPGVKVRLMDPDGRDVPPGEVGEILVQSQACTIGYWNDPKATAAALQDGWLRTGDLARVDEDGYYWFVGRKKEIIIRGGSNISPLEVEEALYQHAAVREAGVVGVPDSTWGEIVHAYVASQDGSDATEADLKQFLQERIAAYKVPEMIRFVPDLPKGSTGKVDRKTLRQWASGAARSKRGTDLLEEYNRGYFTMLTRGGQR